MPAARSRSGRVASLHARLTASQAIASQSAAGAGCCHACRAMTDHRIHRFRDCCQIDAVPANFGCRPPMWSAGRCGSSLALQLERKCGTTFGHCLSLTQDKMTGLCCTLGLFQISARMAHCMGPSRKYCAMIQRLGEFTPGLGPLEWRRAESWTTPHVSLVSVQKYESAKPSTNRSVCLASWQWK